MFNPKGNRAIGFAFLMMLAAAGAVFFKNDLAEVAIRFQKDKHFVRINDEYFRVDLAVTPDQWQRGLMFRERLEENQGMLFIGASEKPRSFWMKNTPVSLDILFIDREGRIVQAAERTTPFSEESIPSGGPALHVLEILGGQSAQRGIRIGDRVEFLFDLPTSQEEDLAH
jgi:uncharacterized membrane protein (UPF0127 family)